MCNEKRRVTELSSEELSVIAAEAGREAVKQTLSAGLPVTGTRGGRIICTYPDDREEIVKDLDQQPRE